MATWETWVIFGLTTLQSKIGVLVAAAVWDFMIGDPRGWLHPVQVMGFVIQGYCHWIWRWVKNPLALRIAGIGLGLGLILGSALSTGVLIHALKPVWSGAAWSVEVLLLASCFAGRSLRAAAEAVLSALQTRSLPEARDILSQYVGRDTADLSEPEILRAVLETVAENATDGVMAPLFYACLGLALPGVGAVPLAIAYKAASTLDSMVGYRTEPYRHIGWFSARLEDGLTWLPCRLTVLTLGALSGKLHAVWRVCRRDASQDPSPNSGWSECAYAAILGVQLGGLNTYKGVVTLKPLLGKPYQPITPERIYYALRLTRNAFLLWVAIAVAFFLA